MLSRLAPRLLERTAQVPIVGSLLEWLHWRKFCAATGPVRLFHGVYRDFRAAAADAPHGHHVGFDNEPSVQRMAGESFGVVPLDYPVLFWLDRLLPACRRLFDFGGNVGTSYFAFSHYLRYAQDMEWVVCEVPAVIAAGRKLAQARNATHLRFTAQWQELNDADVLLALGSLHFLESPFHMFETSVPLPRHLLFNKVPIHEGPAVVTLHNMGSAFCPYHLFNRGAFEGVFRKLGYDLIDRWTNPELGAHIPLHRRESIGAYSGYYFRRSTDPTSSTT